jgi:hypothetical protein
MVSTEASDKVSDEASSENSDENCRATLRARCGRREADHEKRTCSLSWYAWCKGSASTVVS